MKRARIVLSAVVLLAVLGGAFAFKAARFTPFAAYTLTNTISSLGTLYSRVAPFYAPVTGVYITEEGVGATSSVFSYTGTTTTLPVTLIRVGGGATLTIPAWRATATTTFTTAEQ